LCPDAPQALAPIAQACRHPVTFAAMLDKLEAIRDRWSNLGESLGDPELVKDAGRFRRVNKEYKDLGVIVEATDRYKAVLDGLEEAEAMLAEDDADMRAMAKGEKERLEGEKAELEEEIRKLLIPKDPEDGKDAILEIRAGTGGDEAALFAGDLYRMYERFAAERGWKLELVSSNPGSAGGYKEIIANVRGEDVYGILKYESGVHRVQRVPATESQGRVHTSAATVAVLPEADEVDIEIRPDELRIDVFRASGAGGQHVNRTESAVRIVHLPSNTTVECQDSRSQIKNRESAMKVLRTRLYEVKLQEHLDKIAGQRKTLVSSGDRSAKIRTYNYPQGRVTDHRINLTLYRLTEVLNGDLTELLETLQTAENAEKLKAGEGV
jgi:peptide chain release factor 1